MVQNLRFLRNRKKLSQQQLAEFMGISQQSINKYENHGVEPDIDTLIKLADFFDTSVDFLIGHTEIDRVMENVSPHDLNDDESRLIDGYRILNKKQKRSIKLIIENYTDK